LNEGRETFDPSIHCVDANGNPKITKAGKFRRKRGKANATVAPSLNPDQINPERMANAKAAAQVSVAATFLMGQLVFGPEGQPQENEPQTMESAYTQFFYLSEKPVNIPPWALVALVVSAYSAKRMAMEQPRSRVYTGIAWIKAKVAAIWEWTMGG
jgi:hypothetical protein